MTNDSTAALPPFFSIAAMLSLRSLPSPPAPHPSDADPIPAPRPFLRSPSPSPSSASTSYHSPSPPPYSPLPNPGDDTEDDWDADDWSEPAQSPRDERPKPQIVDLTLDDNEVNIPELKKAAIIMRNEITTANRDRDTFRERKDKAEREMEELDGKNKSLKRKIEELYSEIEANEELWYEAVDKIRDCDEEIVRCDLYTLKQEGLFAEKRREIIEAEADQEILKLAAAGAKRARALGDEMV